MKLFILFTYFLCTYGANINVQQLSQARQNIASASLSSAGIGMFAGGYYYTGSVGPKVFTASDKIDIYNVNNNSWSLNTLPNPAYDVGSASLDNKGIILFAGGTNSTNFFNNVQVYTAWKLYKFYNVRKMLLNNEGLPITWRNVIFVEQAIEQKKKLEMTEIGGGDETPILQADQLKKVQDTISTIQTKITLLEAK